ncbi:hypothetical protein [Echinicola sp. 20G]|uniref:hypothetical protein n=1 Tax=Echinicola sp. 20G TaxID=2781961 RepID=UPI0019108054|nr:hypothetical protein [Echinicola sp. 20G]
MGFVPIFLTLGGFIFLFVLVVNHSIKSKKEQYKAALAHLSSLLPNNKASEDTPSLEKLASLIDKDKDKSSEILSSFGKAKLLRHQYNELIKKSPYSFVAKVSGHNPI